MRYILVEYNERDPTTPNVKSFASRKTALEHERDSRHECALYCVSSDLLIKEVEIQTTPHTPHS